MTNPDSNSDAWLDAQLRNVPLPDGLVARLERVVAAEDEQIDAALRNVRLPALLLWRLRRIVEEPTRLVRFRRWATAASVFLAIGLSYVAAMLMMLASSFEGPASPQSPLAPYFVMEIADVADRQVVEFQPSTSLAATGTGADGRPGDSAVVGPEIELVALDSRGYQPLGFEMYPVGASSNINPLLDSELSRWPPPASLASHDGFDKLSDLKLVPGLVTRWAPPPVVPGFDIFFFREFGVHPFVSPSAHPVLRVSQVPLDVDTSSYELTRRYLEDGMLPPRGVLRTEEFLAAIDYGYPVPAKGKGLALHAVGGPSWFRGGDYQLLQIGVKAEQVEDHRRPGTRLTLVLDVSASMRWGGRLDIVRLALKQLGRRMALSDRISMVVFDEHARIMGEDIARDEMEQLVGVLADVVAEGPTNVGEGLRLGCALARRQDGVDKRLRRVVLLTDGLAELDGGTAGWIEQRLRKAAADGIPLDVVDLGQERNNNKPDPQLVRFATAGGGEVHPATSAEQVRWALLEAASGQSQLVASESRLRVVFNPNVVLAYRLLGHESKGIVVLDPPHLEAEMRSGQSATALYEVRLKPGGGDHVATAELTWSDPRTGRQQSLQRKYRRGQFAQSVAQSPPSLQAAIVVAQTVEVLRDVPYTWGPQGKSGLSRVLEFARRLDSRVYQRPSFDEFVTMLGQAVKAKPYRRGGYK